MPVERRPVPRGIARPLTLQLGDGAPQGLPSLAYVEFQHLRKDARIRILDGVKRVLDIALALVLLAALAPVMVATALAVRASGPGPIVFRQQRIGRGARAFTMYKFRTMHADAADHEDRMAEAAPDRVFFKPTDDARVTRTGRFLRKFSLDELPQLFNVLIGDMSLVGPRPLLPCDYRKFPYDERQRRFEVRPGLTGLWQVSGRSLCTDEERLRLDLEYVRIRSLRLDLRILLLTPFVVLSARGAY